MKSLTFIFILLLWTRPIFGCWTSVHEVKVNASKVVQLNQKNPFLFELDDSLKLKLIEFLEKHQYSNRTLIEHQKRVNENMRFLYDGVFRTFIVRDIGESFQVGDKNFRVVRILGNGAEGVAYEVESQSGKVFALKQFYSRDFMEDNLDSIELVKSEPIPSVKVHHINREEDFIVTDMARGVTVDKIIDDQTGFFTLEERTLINAYFEQMQEINNHRQMYMAEPNNAVIDIKTWQLLLFDVT